MRGTIIVTPRSRRGKVRGRCAQKFRCLTGLYTYHRRIDQRVNFDIDLFGIANKKEINLRDHPRRVHYKNIKRFERRTSGGLAKGSKAEDDNVKVMEPSTEERNGNAEKILDTIQEENTVLASKAPVASLKRAILLPNQLSSLMKRLASVTQRGSEIKESSTTDLTAAKKLESEESKVATVSSQGNKVTSKTFQVASTRSLMGLVQSLARLGKAPTEGSGKVLQVEVDDKKETKQTPEIWTLEKVIASLYPQPPPPPETFHSEALPSPNKLTLVNPVPNRPDPNYPSMVIVNPKAHSVTPFPSSEVAGSPIIPLGLEKFAQPPTLFFSVDGQVDMPVFSLSLLDHFARKDRQRQAGYAVPCFNDSDHFDEEQDSPEQKCVKPRRKNMKTSEGAAPTKKIACHLCGSRFRNAYYLSLHANRAHNEETKFFSCRFCSSSYKTLPALKYHVNGQHCQSDVPETPFECPFCKERGNGLTFLEKESLIQHLRKHWNHGCGKKRVAETPKLKSSQAATKAPLKVDLKLANAKKKVAEVKPKKKKQVCDFCSRSFRNSYELNVHLRVHTGFRPWPCTLCEQRFYIRSSLADHVATIHSSREKGRIGIACPFCPREKTCGNFENEAYLRKHLYKDHQDKLQEIPE